MKGKSIALLEQEYRFVIVPLSHFQNSAYASVSSSQSISQLAFKAMLEPLLFMRLP